MNFQVCYNQHNKCFKFMQGKRAFWELAGYAEEISIWKVCVTDMYREISRPFGRLVYWFESPNSGTQITFFKLFFQLCLNKKIHWSSNQWFHLITLKWRRRQKCRQKRKTMRCWSQKKNYKMLKPEKKIAC